LLEKLVNEELDVRKRVAFDLAMDNMLSVCPKPLNLELVRKRVAFDLAMDNMLSVSPKHEILASHQPISPRHLNSDLKTLIGGLDLAVPGLGDEGPEEGEICPSRRPSDEEEVWQEVACIIGGRDSRVAFITCCAKRLRRETLACQGQCLGLFYRIQQCGCRWK
jgi:hypothetical protein